MVAQGTGNGAATPRQRLAQLPPQARQQLQQQLQNLPPAARQELQQQLQQQRQAANGPEMTTEGTAPATPQIVRPGQQPQLRTQFNPRNLDVAEYRALRGLDEDQLAELVLPLPPVAPGDASTPLGRLLLDPTYQLK